MKSPALQLNWRISRGKSRLVAKSGLIPESTAIVIDEQIQRSWNGDF